jgi:ubiquitin-protein ligase
MIGVNVEGNSGEFLGDADEFKHGQFFGSVTATKSYPFSPPTAVFYTATGVFPVDNPDFCVDIGSYHKSDWPATYGMDGFVNMIWSGLVGWRDMGQGINLSSGRINKTVLVEIIRKASAESQAYNQEHNKKYLDIFADSK